MNFCPKSFLGLWRHDDEQVAYGYPPYKHTWVTIYKCKKCERLLREWDDLFADPRPDSWPLEEDHVLYKCPDGEFRPYIEIEKKYGN